MIQPSRQQTTFEANIIHDYNPVCIHSQYTLMATALEYASLRCSIHGDPLTLTLDFICTVCVNGENTHSQLRVCVTIATYQDTTNLGFLVESVE